MRCRDNADGTVAIEDGRINAKQLINDSGGILNFKPTEEMIDAMKNQVCVFTARRKQKKFGSTNEYRGNIITEEIREQCREEDTMFKRKYPFNEPEELPTAKRSL